MELEFAILFRENETKRKKTQSSSAKKSKVYKNLYKVEESKDDYQNAFVYDVLSPAEQSEMQKYVDKKETEKLALLLKKKVVEEFKRKKKLREIMMIEEDQKKDKEPFGPESDADEKK